MLFPLPCFKAFFSFKIFIYLFTLAASGLSCGMRDICCGVQDLSLRHTGSLSWHAGFSLVVARRLQSTQAQ